MVLHNSRNGVSVVIREFRFNKACFAKYLYVPSTHEESRFEAVVEDL